MLNPPGAPGSMTYPANYLFEVANNGDLSQRLYYGGLVKAAVLVYADGSANLCYNSQSPGTCGITTARVPGVTTGGWDVTFPFQVNTRFISATIAIPPNGIIETCDIAAAPSATQTIRVYTAGYDNAFYLTVY